MKKNWALLLSFALLSLLAIMIIFPEWFTGQNPYALSFIRFWTGSDGSLKIATSPYPPSPLNPIGTDQMGRDLLSFLVYGCRLTLLLAIGITASRFLLGLPLGIASGMGSAVSKRLISRFNLVFTAIPPLLVSIIILHIDLFATLYKAQSILIFTLTLTLVGWSKLAHLLSASTEKIMAETFILSEKAVGKSNLKISKEHVLPHLLPEVIILFAMEIAAVLTLLMQLGIFGIFVGNLKIIKDSASSGYSYFNITFEPEWASLLGTARDYIRVAPWIALSAGIFFFLTVLAFNLLGEGLRQHIQQNTRAYKQRKNPKTFKQAAFAGLSLLILVVLLKWQSPEVYTEVYDATNIQSELTNAQSSQGGEASWLEAKFEHYGLEPLSDLGYRQTFDKNPQFKVAEVHLKLSGEDLSFGTDFLVLGGSDLTLDGTLIDGTAAFYSGLPAVKGPGLILYLDQRLIPMSNILESLPRLKKQGVKAVITASNGTRQQAQALDIPVLVLSETHTAATEDKLRSESAIPVSLHIGGSIETVKGMNFAAIQTGAEPTMAKNLIVIGMDYHGPTEAEKLNRLAFYFNLMEQLKSETHALNRSIVYLFFDGSEGLRHYGDHVLVQSKNVNLYLDLTQVDGSSFNKLRFSDELSPISRYYGFIFSKQFKENGKALLSPKNLMLTDHDRLLSQTNGLTTVIIKTETGTEHPISELGELLKETLLKNAY